MITKELIRQEIERLKEENRNIRCQHNEQYYIGYDDAFDDLLSSLDTLPEEPVSDDLEEAAEKYDEAESWRWEALKYPRREAFKAGAEWQKEKMKKGNPIVMSVEDFQALIDNTIKRAEKEAREQMMNNAVDIKVIESYNPACDPDERLHGISFIYDCKNDNQYLIAGDKAKIIIVKEKE